MKELQCMLFPSNWGLFVSVYLKEMNVFEVFSNWCFLYNNIAIWLNTQTETKGEVAKFVLHIHCYLI